jgi:hypothetical protein
MLPGDLGSNHIVEALKQARTEYGASQTLLNEIPERVLRQFPAHITNWPGCLATVSRATDFSSSRPGSRPRPGPGTLPTMSGLSVRARAGDPRPAAPYPQGAGHPGRAPTGIRGREHARAGTPAGPSARRYPVALQRADPPPRVPPRPDPIGQTTTGPTLRRSAGDPGGTAGRGSSHSRSLSGADAVGNPTTDDAESGDRAGPSAGPPGRRRTGAR